MLLQVSTLILEEKGSSSKVIIQSDTGAEHYSISSQQEDFKVEVCQYIFGRKTLMINLKWYSNRLANDEAIHLYNNKSKRKVHRFSSAGYSYTVYGLCGTTTSRMSQHEPHDLLFTYGTRREQEEEKKQGRDQVSVCVLYGAIVKARVARHQFQ